MSVAVCSALVVEIFGGTGSGDSGEGPDEAHDGESIVFHVASANRDSAPEALVMGTAPANAFSSRGQRNGCGHRRFWLANVLRWCRRGRES